MALNQFLGGTAFKDSRESVLPRGFRKAVQEDRCRRSLIGRFRLPSLLASCFDTRSFFSLMLLNSLTLLNVFGAGHAVLLPLLFPDVSPSSTLSFHPSISPPTTFPFHQHLLPSYLHN